MPAPQQLATVADAITAPVKAAPRETISNAPVPVARAAERIAFAAELRPDVGAAALRVELERLYETDDRVKLIATAAPQIATISRAVNAATGRTGEQALKAILKELSAAADLSGPRGARALAEAFGSQMRDSHLDLDNGDQFGGALITTLRDGASPAFALELPGALRDQGRCPEAQAEITKALSRGLAGVPLTPAQSRLQLENLALHPKVDAQMVAMAHAPTASPAPELLVNGGEVFPRILEDLRNATDSIHIAQYGFKEGALAREVVELLKQKVKEGVEVSVLVDEIGSQPNRGQKALYEELAAAGVTVLTNDSLSPKDMDGPLGAKTLQKSSDELGAPDHRKLYVIDGKVAYTGGMGIEDHFVDKQHDVMVRMTGEIAQQMQTTFLSSYLFHGGELPAGAHALDRYYPDAAPAKGGVKATVLNNVPKAGWHPIAAEYLKQIDSAKRSLEIVNPYFGDDEIVARLCAAAERGVKVTLVLPRHAENPLNDAAQRKEYAKLIAAGVDVREYPTMVHAKLMVIDGERVLVGTANLDKFSMHKNWELDVLYEDARTARDYQQRIFEKDLQIATVATAPGGGGPKGRLLRWAGERVMG